MGNDKIYAVAEIAYEPNNLRRPWYIIRTGVVAEQGGLNFGSETIRFETVDDALEYLEQAIKRDLEEFKKEIKRVELKTEPV